MSDDAREAAYQALAVANSNPPLRPSCVAYIELVASPDPRVEPFVFALEHTRVRVGRFSTEGTYATSSDLFVAVSEDATAIAPMNAMFEFIDGSFHVFDTRSPNGTAVNGEAIKKRRVLAAGDVIEIGGIADGAGVRTGGARIVFLGATPPPDRPVLRAPVQTVRTWRSPRGSVEIEVDATAGTARATIDMPTEWSEPMFATVERVAAITSPYLPATTVGDVTRYEVGEPLKEIEVGWCIEPAVARAIVADVCDAAAACHEVGGELILIGPFDRRLVWRRADGRALVFGAGLSRAAYQLDQAKRGAMMTMRHFRMSPEEVMGRPTGPASDVYFAAYLLVELITNHEPYPIEEFTTYLEAVRNGHPDVPDDLPAEVTRAFEPDPSARPTLGELAAALRGEPPRAPEASEPAPRRSWWSRWFGSRG
ncbi:MAG: serine/threonine-protein kinase [Kofleriaceae bacterium]